MTSGAGDRTGARVALRAGADRPQRPAVRAVQAMLIDGDGDPIAEVRMVLSSALPPRVVLFLGRPYLLIGKVRAETPTYQYSRPYLADGDMVTEISRARP
jgi:hypothetical protein